MPALDVIEPETLAVEFPGPLIANFIPEGCTVVVLCLVTLDSLGSEVIEILAGYSILTSDIVSGLGCDEIHLGNPEYLRHVGVVGNLRVEKRVAWILHEESDCTGDADTDLALVEICAVADIILLIVKVENPVLRDVLRVVVSFFARGIVDEIAVGVAVVIRTCHGNAPDGLGEIVVLPSLCIGGSVAHESVGTAVNEGLGLEEGCLIIVHCEGNPCLESCNDVLCHVCGIYRACCCDVLLSLVQILHNLLVGCLESSSVRILV